MPQREPLEVLARHAREIGVLDGEHGRRARLAREERHLADETARAHFVDQRRRAVRVLRADAQASAQDQVDVAVGVALAQQRRAAGERRVAQHAPQVRERGGRERVVEAVLDEKRLEFGREWRVVHARWS